MDEGGGKKNGKAMVTLSVPQYTPALKPNPEASAGFISRMTIQFITRFMFIGWRRTLTAEDMFEPLENHQSKEATSRLRKAWEAEERKASEEGRPPSLRKTIFRTYGWDIGKLGFLLLIEELIHLAQPIFIGILITYFKLNSEMTRNDALLAAAGVAISSLLTVSIHHPYFYGLQKHGMAIKSAVSGLIIEKGVRLSSSALHETTVGNIVNILSTDVAKFDTGFIFIHYMWVGPILLFSYIGIIWMYIGVSALAGFGVIVVLLPVQAFFGKTMGTFRRVTAQRSDKRISVMSEILNGIKVIKMYAWEDAFSAIIDELRAYELQAVKRYGLVQSTMLGLFWATGKLVILAAVICYVHTGNVLTSEIFVVAALFNSCRLPITLFLPFSFHCLFDMLVATERIQKVLLLDEFGERSYMSGLKMNGTITLSDSDGEKLLATVENGKESEEWAKVKLEPTERPFVHLDHFTATWQTAEGKKDTEKEDEKETDVDKEGDEKEKNIDSPSMAVVDISLRAEKGVIAVIGPVGAGKSSLLASILRETRRLTGSIRVDGRIAYCSQDAWIFSGTLRENILFGSPFDEDRYRRAIELSALSTDLQQLSRGDGTMVGDRGASLSGGQKARVSLARALYRDAEIYLLDDPLSAVDASVGRFIYDKCISKGLKDKVVILVTHQVQFVDYADVVVVMKGGRVVVQGPPDKIWEDHGDELKEIIQETRKSYRRHLSSDKRSDRMSGGTDDGNDRDDGNETNENEALLDDIIDEPAEEKKNDENGDTGMDEEQSAEGSVPWSVYWEYMKAMGARRPFQVAPVMFVVVVAQLMFVVVDWWLKKWTDASEKAQEEKFMGEWEDRMIVMGKNVTVTSNEYEYWFTGMTVFVLIIAVGRCLWFRLLEVDASRHLHKTMFNSIVHTRLQFFDRNPIGRILNRFSKDVSTMDDMISMVFFEFIVGMLNFGCLVGMIFFLNPWIVLATLPLAALFYFIREIYLATSRDLKRLEATSRSPLYSHISALMNGLITIRAFGCENTVMDKYHKMQNVNIASFYLSMTTSRWFAVWIDWLVTIFVTAVAFFCIFTKELSSSGDVALMLTYAVQLTGFFSWIMRQSAELQNGMVSIERIVNYAALPREEKEEKTKKRELAISPRSKMDGVEGQSPQWPSHGHVEMRDVWMRYGDEGSEFVLRGVNLNVKPAEKIGIVGRTGAGKSSLLRALFRLTVPTKGHIIIDDVDTATVPLRTLRKSIGIIPQEPVLFVGSIRKNLDPFDEFTDDQLWEVLELVELRTFVAEMGQGLNSAVQEGGANVSVGQRQLICLARALLRKTTILVIDEATANVDNKTDALIQHTIRTSFAHATVLTIAHRLHTIMDSNRVLVLEHGEVKQLDTPYALLQEEGGMFLQLVRETGKSNEAHLREIARKANEGVNKE